jgi:hypothetical protein
MPCRFIYLRACVTRCRRCHAGVCSNPCTDGVKSLIAAARSRVRACLMCHENSRRTVPSVRTSGAGTLGIDKYDTIPAPGFWCCRATSGRVCRCPGALYAVCMLKYGVLKPEMRRMRNASANRTVIRVDSLTEQRLPIAPAHAEGRCCGSNAETPYRSPSGAGVRVDRA